MAGQKRTLERPIVFVYQNYREYLRDLYLYKKQESADFSYRKFSELAAFKSPNFLKRVIDGERNLTLVSLKKIATGFRLSASETTHFRRLVDLNQAKNTAERNRATRELVKSTVFRELHPLTQAELDLYQLWYCIPIREMVAHPGFHEDYDWIGKSLRPHITALQARTALETLMTLGLVIREPGGNLAVASGHVATENEVRSAAIAGFHKQMLEFASLSIDQVERSRRLVSGTTVLISEANFDRMKELIQSFALSLMADLGEPAGSVTSQSVYQISFQAFPLSESLEVSPEKVCKKAG